MNNESKKDKKKKPVFVDKSVNPHQVMPIIYYKAEHLGGVRQYSDQDWIAMMMNILSRDSRGAAARTYVEHYQKGLDSTDVSYQKESAARINANSFLRELVEKQLSEGSASALQKNAESWEIMAYLSFKPEAILENLSWHKAYLKHALSMNPKLVLEIELCDTKNIEFAITKMPALVLEIKEADRALIKLALMRDKKLYSKLRSTFPQVDIDVLRKETQEG